MRIGLVLHVVSDVGLRMSATSWVVRRDYSRGRRFSRQLTGPVETYILVAGLSDPGSHRLILEGVETARWPKYPY